MTNLMCVAGGSSFYRGSDEKRKAARSREIRIVTESFLDGVKFFSVYLWGAEAQQALIRKAPPSSFSDLQNTIAVLPCPNHPAARSRGNPAGRYRPRLRSKMAKTHCEAQSRCSEVRSYRNPPLSFDLTLKCAGRVGITARPRTCC